jgi:hypothetical protein
MTVFHRAFTTWIWATLLCSTLPAWGQSTSQQAPLVSQIDQQLTIRSISLYPILDNVEGIYSKSVEAELKDFLSRKHQFNFRDLTAAGSTEMPLLDLRENPAAIQSILKSNESESLLIVQLNKGPKGMTITSDLYLALDGMIVASQTVKDINRFELAEIKEQAKEIVQRTLKSIPYDGLILSRNDQKVTINMGRRDGLKANQTVNAVLLLGVQRHPKFNFVVSVEKEVIGKIKLFKVDDTLSFGHITFEKERGAIQRFTKIGGLDNVTYPDPESLEVVTGNTTDNKEWVPVNPPSFGQVGMRLGLGSYSNSITLNSGIGGIEGKTMPYPSFTVLGELWLNPNWIVRGSIREALASYKNPRANSTPTNLTSSNSTYTLQAGYNFLLHGDFWGPRFSVLAGYYQYNSLVTSSNPTAFTTMRYGGFNLSFEGVIPLDKDRIWALGANYFFVYNPELTESPELSGKEPENSVTSFSLFGRKKIGENLHAVVSLDFEMYSSRWVLSGTRSDGASASSAAQTVQSISGGINYLF